MAQSERERRAQTIEFNFRLLFLTILVIGALISLYNTWLLRQDHVGVRRINRPALEFRQRLQSYLFLIAATYFLYLNIKNLIKTPHRYNFWYAIAALLTFIAAIINTKTLLAEQRNPIQEPEVTSYPIPVTGFPTP